VSARVKAWLFTAARLFVHIYGHISTARQYECAIIVELNVGEEKFSHEANPSLESTSSIIETRAQKKARLGSESADEAQAAGSQEPLAMKLL